MNEARDTVRHAVEPLLRAFGERISAHDPAVRSMVRFHSNDAFLIWGYVSFWRTNDGESVDVGVSAAYKDGGIALTSDAGMETGEVLAEGPEATMPLSEMMSLDHTQLAEWLKRLKDFLAASEAVVKQRVAAL